MFENTTVKRREEEPRFFEVWQNLECFNYWKFRLNRFLIFMKRDTVVDYKKLL